MGGKFLRNNAEDLPMLGKKASHAIHALVTMASLSPGGVTTAAELAGHMRLSVSYLESLLKVLREHALVSSVRGPGGGYRMAVPASQLSLWSVAQAFALPQAPRSAAAPQQIDLDALLLTPLEAHFQSILEASTIADHVDESRALRPRREPAQGAWGFKPLVPRWMPEAPNSVFQLSQFMGVQAVA
jgi:Rrf2 family iron-sulfur cluster assembly transcriptional regulator